MSNPFYTISVEEMDAVEMPAVAWAVDGVLPHASFTILGGLAKSGKSLFAIDLGISVAAGDPFLGRAVEQTRVLYGAAEDHFSLVRDRLRTRLGKDRGVPFAVLPADGSFDQVLRLDDDGTTLSRLIDTIDAGEYGLLILDPLRELHNLGENDSDDMAPLLRPLRKVAHEKGVAILLLHHTTKFGSDPIRSLRGSGAISGSCDVVIGMRVDGDDDDAGITPDKTATFTVLGRYAPRQRITARLGVGLRWQTTDAVAPDTSLAARIVHLLSELRQAATAQEIADALKASLNRTQEVLKALVDRGEIARLGKGTKGAPYVYATAPVSEGRAKGGRTGYESVKTAVDESADEYFPAQQGKRVSPDDFALLKQNAFRVDESAAPNGEPRTKGGGKGYESEEAWLRGWCERVQVEGGRAEGAPAWVVLAARKIGVIVDTFAPQRTNAAAILKRLGQAAGGTV